jgi:hypothetical protein
VRDELTLSITLRYLQASSTHEDSNWHCRIDIPYVILEHIIGSRGTMTFTLKSPPKIYKIRSTDDLHLYAGHTAPQHVSIYPDIASLNLGLDTKIHRLERLTSLQSSLTMNTSLCMIYKIAFPDMQTARHAYYHVKDLPALQIHCRETMAPRISTPTIEKEYADVMHQLSCDDSRKNPSFEFVVRFQLMALVLEGIVTPLKMLEMIPRVQELASRHGAEPTALSVRQLGQHIPIPAPHTAATHFSLKTLIDQLMRGIRGSQTHDSMSIGSVATRARKDHLALTYKATITPTGT